ncbi:MAG: polysaccharide deacetylase family protein [Bacteroidales bacterium]|nr:polysaccharide deacetylase family protein [Bacteroidales bacterium]MCF8337151.1 polysaccharide deacetylase family protein [Bacteroidales bacterium]
MKGFLNKAKIDYVFFHLNHVIKTNDTLRKKIIILKSNENISQYRNKIIFLLTDRELDRQKIKRINDIPVLFPMTESKEFFYMDKNNNIVFFDDLLKSSFFLLSGYQEFKSNAKDKLGRFPYKNSIQKFLNITQKPIVNYYFDNIKEGIIKFCHHHSISYTTPKIFKNFGFLLTHDVDKVDYYTKWYIGYKIKELLGFVKSKYSFKQNMIILLKGLFQYLNFVNRKNPAWDFNFLLENEKKHNFRSAFYFLNKDVLHKDSYYTYGETRIVNLINWLYRNGCEIGLHGTVNSASDLSKLQEVYNKLQSIAPEKIAGGRQHRLLMKLPQTLENHKIAGLDYDTTLGFAEHEGFRNSYCLPFKPYNFEEDRMIDIWELPLNVMDTTLFEYRKLTFEQVKQNIENIIGEVKKFDGLFTFLLHNGYFDGIKHPGIENFYEKILDTVSKHNPENLLGKEIAERMKKIG